MTVRRRDFIARSAAFVVVTLSPSVLTSCASQIRAVRTPRRIGYLSNAFTPADPTQGTPSLSKAFRELGYNEGRDLLIETRFSEGDRDRLPALAAELVGLNPEVIVTTGGPTSALAARGATTAIPIVFTGLSDPQGFGLVTDLSRPGGNLTGVVNDINQAKRLELLQEAAPHVRRVALLFNEKDSGAVLNVQAAEDAARALGLRSTRVVLNTPDELDAALTAIARAQVDGLFDTHGVMFYGRGYPALGPLLDFAVAHQLPQIFNGVDYARAGGLMALGVHTEGQWRAVARLVDRILKGANTGDLPVEFNNTFELGLNLPMARRIGLTFPESVLRQATEVIN